MLSLLLLPSLKSAKSASSRISLQRRGPICSQWVGTELGQQPKRRWSATTLQMPGSFQNTLTTVWSQRANMSPVFCHFYLFDDQKFKYADTQYWQRGHRHRYCPALFARISLSKNILEGNLAA
jgi:hypothetical protein